MTAETQGLIILTSKKLSAGVARATPLSRVAEILRFHVLTSVTSDEHTEIV